jgi:arsenic resistance protein ArsH
MIEFPALQPQFVDTPTLGKLEPPQVSTHPPRILLLYGSLRERSYSRFLVEEAARILQRLGAETQIFDPRDLPLPDSVPADHPKCRSCGRYPCGPRARCGAARSGTAPSPTS